VNFGKKAPSVPIAHGTPASTDRPSDPVTRPASLTGLLAGQVIDSYNQRPSNTFIQVVEGSGNATPIEVAADSQGYFTIQGLQPGHHYQLTARTRNGERMLAGTTWATPPDPKVLIRISEDYASPGTPPLPSTPAITNAGQPPMPALGSPSLGSASGDSAWSPFGNRTQPNVRPRAAEIGPPVGAVAEPPMRSQPPLRPESIAQNPLAQNTAPLAEIPAQGPHPERSLPERDAAIAMPAIGSALVPSCVLTGQILNNFALYDLNGQPWEYQRQHRGRLLLLDFWGTWCVYCMQSIPHLNSLQDRFGRYGLEVVGIAYEDGTFVEQVQKVNRVRQLRQIHYQLLLGSGRERCPVRTQFGVLSWPTLVLLDEGGRIIWRGEGLDTPQLRELEIIIRQRLGVR
jgi:thiol-disulfide isomerase/thioredoxin